MRHLRSRMLARAVIVATMGLVLALPLAAGAAEVFVSPTRTDADVVIFESATRSDSTCLIYRTTSRTEARGRATVWFMSPTRSDADLVVFRGDTRVGADLLVYFVGSATEARCPQLAGRVPDMN